MAMHRMDALNSFIWRYFYEGEWYLCRQTENNSDEQNQDSMSGDESALYDIQQTLNFF